MRLGAISTVFVDRPLEEAAAKMHALGLECIEIGTGGHFPKNHCDPHQLLTIGEAVYHVHAKDSRVDPHVTRVNGVLDGKSLQETEYRNWLFRTIGYGHGEEFWRNFVSTLRTVGYDDVLSVEHEDPLIDPEEGLELAVDLLKGVLVRKPPTKVWFE